MWRRCAPPAGTGENWRRLVRRTGGRSTAELRRTAAAMAAPQVASEYTFVIAAVNPASPEREWLVGE